MKMKRILLLLLVFALSFSMIGCGAKDVSNNVEEEKSLEGTTLKVVAAYGGKEQIFQQFTDETGIKVEFIDMSSGEVLARTEAEGGKPMADVWFGGGADSFIAAKDKGLLEQYSSPEGETIPAICKDKDGYWTGISLVLTGFLVNNEVLEEKGLEAPTKWEDLTKSEYKDEILMADPGISGTNYAIVNCTLQDKGKEAGWKYFEDVSKNIPFFAKRGGEPPKKAAAGEIAIGIAPMSGEFIGMEEKYPVKAIYPQDGIPWVPASMAVFKNADNLDGAKAFVDWALSKHGQEVIRDADPRVMARPDVDIPEMMKDVPLDSLLDVNFEVFGEQRDEILETWTEKIAK